MAEARVAEARRMLDEAMEFARQAQAKKAATVTANCGALAPAAAAPGPTVHESSGRWCIFSFANGRFTRQHYATVPPDQLSGEALAPYEEPHVCRYEDGSVVAYFTKEVARSITAVHPPKLQGVAVDTGHNPHLLRTMRYCTRERVDWSARVQIARLCAY